MKNKNLIIITSLLLIFIFTSPILADKIELQNGSVLRGEVNNSSIRLKNSYAEIDIQTQFINKIDRENGTFIFRLPEKNKFSGEIIDSISFKGNAGEENYDSSNIKSIVFSNTSSFNNNKSISVKTDNGDFFFANTVEDGINIKTSLGSPLNIKYNNITGIEYLNNENLYLIKRKDESEVKAEFAQQKIILWPAAGEIFELDLNFLRRLIVE